MNLKTTDFERHSTVRTQLYEYTPPPPRISALVTPKTHTFHFLRMTVAIVFGMWFNGITLGTYNQIIVVTTHLC